jgi:hypothetical protein
VFLFWLLEWIAYWKTIEAHQEDDVDTRRNLLQDRQRRDLIIKKFPDYVQLDLDKIVNVYHALDTFRLLGNMAVHGEPPPQIGAAKTAPWINWGPHCIEDPSIQKYMRDIYANDNSALKLLNLWNDPLVGFVVEDSPVLLDAEQIGRGFFLIYLVSP